MGYFSYLASSQFQKTEDGKSLFYIGLCGPFSRPYLIETPEEETALKIKVTTFYKCFFLLFIIPCIIYLNSLETLDAKIFFRSIFVGCIFWYLLLKIWVSKEIKNMKKSESKISLHQFYKSIAEKHSFLNLILGLIGSLGFIALFIFIKTDIPHTVFVFSISISGIFALLWGYILFLKQK